MSVPRLLAVTLAIVGVLLAALVGRVGVGSPAARSAPAAASAVPAQHTSGSGPHRSAERRALRVLHAWDEQRAGAYLAGSKRRLSSLYAAGSSAGRLTCGC